jgi:hypothetical protein
MKNGVLNLTSLHNFYEIQQNRIRQRVMKI